MSSIILPFSLNQLPIPLTPRAKFNFPSKSISPSIKKPFLTRIHCSKNTKTQQPNLSVLRFTLGISGLDESYLPRYIGYAFGALILLNHFVGSDSVYITNAQLRTEALGLSLVAFSVAVPYLGKFLKGSTPIDRKNVPENTEQVFAMSQNISDTLKEDLAWGTYVLLRNTNSISVLILVQDTLCVRGYWNVPKDVAKNDVLDWFEKQIEGIGLSNLKDSLYFTQTPDSEFMKMVPDGTLSLLVQPIFQDSKSSFDQTQKNRGFVLLASNMDYAYGAKDRAWITAIANKFRG